MSPPDVRTALVREPNAEHTTTDRAILAQNADAGKQFCTLQAQLALRGFELRRADDGSFLIIRWTLCRTLADLDAVAAFAIQVGATA